MSTSAPRVLVMAGGTGGHVFPALAVAQALRERGWQVDWLGSGHGMEVTRVPAAGFPLHALPIAGIRRTGWASRLLAPWRLGLSLWGALFLLLRLRPQVVLGFGGFAAGPGGLMASALGRTLFIHEQNARAGLTNRWLARVADRIFSAFPEAFPAAVSAEVIGNPLRTEILALPPPEERWAGRQGPLRVLVLGGSLGARALNQTVPAALRNLPLEQRPVVRHQAGTRTLALAQTAYREAQVEAEVVEFIEDMAAAYGWADLVIARAGALTVSELAAVGVAGLLIPYPYAVDDHQTANAHFLEQAGAAWSLSEAACTPQTLADLLSGVSRQELLERAQRAYRLRQAQATRRLVEACAAALATDRPGGL
jgi:UDP-N-acetylglucosamine--N-acetylmuramyl-(pentapeptide) pyrophosphoryl-undecaprenol N-acetylglucosamine transferase